VHHGEFNERMARRRADGTPQGCEACHSVRSWADVNGFDHSKTKFPLLGAHRAAKCGDLSQGARARRKIQFKTRRKFAKIVIRRHDSQFAKAGKTLCGDCHDSQRWVSPLSTMNPDAFSLAGRTCRRACDKCHKQTRMVEASP